MKIGRVVRLLTDEKRKEFLKATDEKRKIIISIFYPADGEPDESMYGLYMDLFYPRQEEFINRYTAKKNSAGQLLDESHLRSIKTNTYNDIPISRKEILYPIIIYSPGLGANRDSIIYNVEKLVSDGYIVFTIGHIYDTDFNILPDGEIVEQSEYVANSNFEEKEQIINIRKEDILFLLNELESLNKNDEAIKDKLDLDKIGIMGHSLGGAAIFKAAAEDTRIKAVVMLDGSLQIFNLTNDLSVGERLSTPFLNFRRGSIDYTGEMNKCIEANTSKSDGEEFKKRIIERHQSLTAQINGQRQLYEYLTGYKSFIKLKNSEHLTFTDFPTIYNLEFVNKTLPIKEAHKIIGEITYRFFDEFLCGKEGRYTSFISDSCSPLICRIDKNGESIE
jgi:hypothetical protein